MTVGPHDGFTIRPALESDVGALGLFIAPTTYHRLRFRQRDKERMLFTANKLTIAGTVLLLIATAGVQPQQQIGCRSPFRLSGEASGQKCGVRSDFTPTHRGETEAVRPSAAEPIVGALGGR